MSKTSAIDCIVGSRLKTCRVLAGLDKAALAEKLMIDLQEIQAFESGSARISAQIMRKICEVLDVRPAYFYERWLEERSASNTVAMRSAAE
jgi:transcriptional regulator with XRE-family HTH domain